MCMHEGSQNSKLNLDVVHLELLQCKGQTCLLKQNLHKSIWNVDKKMSKLPNFQIYWLCYKSTFQMCCKAQNRMHVWGLGLLRNHKLHLDVAQLVLLRCKFLWHGYLAKAREDMSLAPSYKLNAMMAITKDPPKYFSLKLHSMSPFSTHP
jgi:hypothetical protein